MLIKCPECELQVSDKAIACPHCGYPINPNKQRARKKPNKRRRLPNGFGQISELKGARFRRKNKSPCKLRAYFMGNTILRNQIEDNYMKIHTSPSYEIHPDHDLLYNSKTSGSIHQYQDGNIFRGAS